VANPAQLSAGTGHAAATLARLTNSTDARTDAQARLGKAIDLLDSTRQARAAALCLAQLATLHLGAGEIGEGVACGARLVALAGGIRSGRLAEHLAIVRTSAKTHADETAVKQLMTDIDGLLGGVDL
jgi:hypothetical protein